MPRPVRFVLPVWMAVFFFFGSQARAVTCSFGAEVSRVELCSYFFYFGPENTSPDPRIVSRLKPEGGDRIRSLALVIGISRYPNLPPENQLPPARNDVVKLKAFLKERQRFDEIIVLENNDATIENISYFLNDYLLSRASLFNNKVRILIAYSGHGIREHDPFPSALILSNATSISDVSNSYSLSLFRTSVETLARASFHVVALINACYGGEVFASALAGGQPSDSYSRGSYALTAGADDQLVYSLGANGQGSIFFETIIHGIDTGEADPSYPTIVVGSNVQRGGVVRLGALSSYLDAEIEKMNGQNPSGPRAPYSAPWIGPIMASRERARGGFFFISPVAQDSLGFGAQQPALVETQTLDASVSSVLGRPDIKIFNDPIDYAVRGVVLNSLNRVDDWDKLASSVRFVYLRLSQGSKQGSKSDPSFASNWTNAKAAGLARGAYHTLTFCESVEKQFEVIRSSLQKSDDMLPFAIEIHLSSEASPEEQDCLASLSKEERKRRVLEMARLVEGYYGKVPLIYGPRQFFPTSEDEQLSRYMIWLRSIIRDPSTPLDVRLGGQNPWALWQYADNAIFPGISGPVEASVFFGTEIQFQMFKVAKVNVPLTVVGK